MRHPVNNSPLKLLKEKLRPYLGDTRSIATVKNIIFVILIKALSVALSFISVPIALRLLNTTDYGVWLTVNSILLWFTILDIGLGNGLRNKVTEALATNNMMLCRIYVSTTYFILAAISLGCCVIFGISYRWIDWQKFFNTVNPDIGPTMLVVVLLFFIRFILQTINIVLQGHNRYSLPGIWDLISNILFLIYLLALEQVATPSLYNVAAGYSIIFTAVFLIQNLYYFYGGYRQIRPAVKFVNLRYSKGLMLLSANFLIIQLGGLIIFSSNNLIISHFINPAEVSVYNIAFKYFNLVTVGWALILTPYLTSFNDAYLREDFPWITKNMKYLNVLWGGIVLMVIVMTVAANWVYGWWIGGKLTIPISVSVLMAVYTVIVARINLCGYFINSTGRLKVSAIYGIFTALVNIPLLYMALRYISSGLSTIIIVNCLILLPNIFLTQIQYQKLMSRKASGIWLK